MARPPKTTPIRLARLLVAGGLGLLLGLCCETVLLLRGQSARFETDLLEDFRVIAFLESGVSSKTRDDIGARLNASPEVLSAGFVSSEEALAALSERDPALVASVSWLGESPLPDSFEVTPDPERLGGLPDWSERMSGKNGISAVSYPRGRFQAIIQAQLYRRYLDLVLGLMGATGVAVCLSAMLAMFAPGKGRGEDGGPTMILASAAGTMGGMGLSSLIIHPLRQADSLWVWPAASDQGLLMAGVVLFCWAILRES